MLSSLELSESELLLPYLIFKLFIISSSELFSESFISLIENQYNKGKTVTQDDVQKFLIIVSNKRKSRKIKQHTKTLLNKSNQ